MNTQLLTGPAAGDARVARPARTRAQRSSAGVVLRPARSEEAAALHALIHAHLEEGRLLPREREELAAHAHRFVVAVRRERIVGCGELAPLSGRVAEVRSLVVDRQARSLGIGRRLVAELQRQARLAGFEQLSVFAHDAAYFARLGFSIVPHTWVPEKIARDCVACPQFRTCGQHALVLSLIDRQRTRVPTYVPLAALRG
jgi:amino-acid N-acetyltransferase